MLPGPWRVHDEIDIAADPSVLRWVARKRAALLPHGPELLLVATDLQGGPMALNLLLNLHRLKYRMAFVVAYEPKVCSVLGRAAERLSSPAAAAAVAGTPCLTDSWWIRHIERKKRNLLDRGQGRWMIRWATFARLIRLGYNVCAPP